MKTKEISVYIDALDCASCAVSIGKTMEKLNIKDFNVLIPLKEVQITFDEEQINEEQINEKQILKELKTSGYKGEIINE